MKPLKIERHFNVSPERVFAIFTNPEEMIVWWTPDTKFDIDLRVDGQYTITREENGIAHRMTGEYLEVEQPNKLKYTCAMPDFSPIVDTITVEIKPDGNGGSKMTFIQVGKGIDEELQQLPEGTVSESEKGWQMGFDLMEQYWNNDMSMNTSKNKQTIRFLYDAVFNLRQFENLPTVISADYVNPTGAKGVGAFQKSIVELVNAFPDSQWETEGIIAEGNKVVVKQKFVGTHKNTFQNIPPTGNTVSVNGIAIYEFREGKIINSQVQTDRFSFLQQLGVLSLKTD